MTPTSVKQPVRSYIDLTTNERQSLVRVLVVRTPKSKWAWIPESKVRDIADNTRCRYSYAETMRGRVIGGIVGSIVMMLLFTVVAQLYFLSNNVLVPIIGVLAGSSVGMPLGFWLGPRYFKPAPFYAFSLHNGKVNPYFIDSIGAFVGLPIAPVNPSANGNGPPVPVISSGAVPMVYTATAFYWSQYQREWRRFLRRIASKRRMRDQIETMMIFVFVAAIPIAGVYALIALGE